MKETSYKRGNAQRESGAALLIAIFALMLISVVAIALIVSQGTDSALAGNYRTSTSAYYAAVAGLEEARGRLLWKNPNYINNTNSYSNLLSPSGLPTWGLTQVLYILNPASGETVDPTSADPASYPDTDYQTEMGWPLSGANVQTINSTYQSASMPGPVYKWVRINPVTEKALNLDVNGDGVLDPTTPLYYDPARVVGVNPAPSLILPSNPSSPTPTAVQALEITSLAVLPNGSKRLLQYVVAPLVVSTQISTQVDPSTPPLPPNLPPNINFPAALTMDGNGISYQDPNMPSYVVNGQDAGNCMPPPNPAPPNPPAPAAVESIEYTNPADYFSINLMSNQNSYPGYPMVLSGPPPGTYVPTIPSIPNPPMPYALRQSWLTPATLDAVVQDITKSADVVITGPATGSNMPTWNPLSPSPMTVVVNGNLNLIRWYQPGYGLLLVTGTLTFDPDATWNGIVLVIGQGVMLWSDRGHGIGGIYGAVLVANTRDASGNLLPVLGPAFFSGVSSGGHRSLALGGIIYNSCNVNSAGAQAPLTYKILSFREIPTN
jgi:hypothetical protein